MRPALNLAAARWPLEECQTRIPTLRSTCAYNSLQHGASYKLQVRIVRPAVIQLLDAGTLGFKGGTSIINPKIEGTCT